MKYLGFILVAVISSFSLAQHIAGMAAVDVTLNLKNVGFDCTNQKIVGDDVNWTCTSASSKYDYTVQVYGSSASKIHLVEATALDFTGEGVASTGLDFLAYIATLPYDDSEPENARDWVKTNYATNEASERFGSAMFTIFTNGKANAILRISATE